VKLFKMTVPLYVFEYNLIMVNTAFNCKGYLAAVCWVYIKLLLGIYISYVH